MTDAEAIERARALYASDDLEIDGTPALSRVDPELQADPGVWVAAWVWVADDEAQDATGAAEESPR